MVKHIILWTLKPELSEEEKESVKRGIKAGLEGLVGTSDQRSSDDVSPNAMCKGTNK